VAAPFPLSGVQRQVKVGASNDPAEHEAERAADHVASGKTGAAPTISRLQTLQRTGTQKQDKPVAGVEPPKAETTTPSKPAAVQRAETGKQTPEKLAPGAQGAKTEDKKPAEAVQRCEECSEESAPQRSSGMASIYRKAKDDSQAEEPVRRQSAEAMDTAASHAVSNKDAGEPIRPDVRRKLEPGLGADLSDVRVHEGPSAEKSAEALNARAFTHKNDVWLGRGESQSDTRLMAHEATHVVQQTGGVQRHMVRRAEAPGAKTAEPTAGWDYEGPEGKVQKGKKLILPLLRVPNFKKPPVTPSSLTLPQKTDEPRPDTQRAVWDKDVKASTGIDTKLDKKITEEKGVSLKTDGEQPSYFFKLKRQEIYVIGSRAAIKDRLLRPYWDRSGKPNSFQVDHKQELQLGGSNLIENMWLLDSDANMSSGRNIKEERDSRIEKLLIAAIKKDVWKEPPDLEGVRRGYTIEVEKVMGGLEVGGSPEVRWTREEIKDSALQLDSLKAMTKEEIDEKGLQGTPSQVVIYTNPTGGGVRISKGWRKGMTEKKEDFAFGRMFHITQVNFDRDKKKGSVEGDVFRDSKLIEQVKLPAIPLEKMDAVDYGGYISVSGLTRTIQHELKLKGLSPIEIGEAELTERGLVARGKVMPNIRPFDKLNIDLVINGDGIYLSKMFSADDFNFPGPIKVTSASLEIFAGTPGIGARGDVFFTIDRLGKGKISGSTAFGEGPKIAGDFDFDTDLFDPAKVHVEYFKGKFSGGGHIGIKAGKVRGIKSASIEASFADSVIDAKGSITPDIPAVEQADLSMHYDETAGLSIAGDLQLKKDIPGIAGGSIHAEVIKKGEKYIVKASGQATPKIPGISSQLNVSYDDGAFDASVTAGYEKGMLKGSVTVGATNRPVGDDGKPAGEVPAKADKITIYGGGSVTLKLAPWLQATAGIRFLPNGEVEVAGKIGLPSALNLFEEKKYDKSLFKAPTIDIPILGFSVLGHNVGIFLSIGGGLDLSAGIGPGQLQELELDVTYNPAHEEDTNVHGHAALHIPAHAGLRLYASAALGAGIPVVDAKAGIELGGSLGIEGALHAGVDIDWTPKKGLVLDAKAEIYAEPKFKFDITGFVLVEVDLLFTTKTLYEKKWELAAVEYGSGLRFGMKLPVHYEEGKPFNVSLSDIEFETPKVDAMDVVKGLIDKII
jgi:hypothetical protein